MAIFSVIVVEILSIEYIMAHSTVLDVVNNFIKMKIISQFDDFFVDPYKMTSMAKFVGINIPVDRFRKAKIYINQSEIMGP